MNKLKFIEISIVILFLQSCGEEIQPARPAHNSSYELTGVYGKDTINLIDGNGLKQGLWIKKRSLGYKTHKILDVVKDTVIYKADEIIGIDTTYYKDGVEQKK